MKSFKLWTTNTIDQNKLEEILGQLQSIEELILCGNSSYFNLDNFLNLKCLSLHPTINNDEFNFEILKNLRIQLEDLTIFISFEDDTNKRDDLKIFADLYFPNLKRLTIINCNMKIVRKKFVDKFPMLRELNINNCNVEMIEENTFSNLKHQLVRLDLENNLIVTLKNCYFSELVNLEYLILCDNRIQCIEKNVFSNLKNLRELDLRSNELSVLDREWFIGAKSSASVFLHDNNLDFDNLFGKK